MWDTGSEIRTFSRVLRETSDPQSTNRFLTTFIRKKYIYTVDTEGLLGFIFGRVHNKFRLGLLSMFIPELYAWHEHFQTLVKSISLLRYK